MINWNEVDSITREKVSVPDGYELRAVDEQSLYWIVKYRNNIGKEYTYHTELTYKITDSEAVLLDKKLGFY